MKTLKLLSSVFALFVLSVMTMSFTSHDLATSAFDVLLPDLRVSNISTPGGLKSGTCSKIRVTVTNSSMAAAKGNIPVILFVSQNGQQPSSYVGYVEGGLGPNANYGKPVWFSNVNIPATGNVTLKAVVNPGFDIQESVTNNNTKIIRARVSSSCGTTTQPAQGATLTVTAYVNGQWNYSNYTPVPGAHVTIVKSGQTYQATAGSNGKATFPSIPTGMCSITVTKSGYQTATKTFNMSSYNNNTNVAMVPN